MSDVGFSLPDRPADLRDRPVAAWAEPVVIPTYPELPPDRNPMFLEKRVYQGSSGRVYPNPFTDRVSDERIEAPWEAIHLENRYVRLMILPDIGGRIHVGMDRTNGYDFFYRQNVIKPALVGLLGPWISGGVEFNWPQHHRPSTFMPVDWEIEERPDGSVTVWCSEHEPMQRMKGMHGVTLYPDSSVVEVRVRLFNRTPFVQTFLWWANVAARVHDRYQSFFPPDVTYVADHAKRAMSTFPVSRGHYYGVDYGARPPAEADLTWYRNIPVPTSYMAMGSTSDFFGGYDHAAEAGFVHVADHRISPGKKQWTWGNHEFGYAWDRELTDADGPYVELMAGVFTDNQPDFSFLQPYETRTFSQCWYPIRAIGAAHEANRDAAVSLGVDGRKARLGVAVTRPLPGARIIVSSADAALLDRRVDLVPEAPFTIDMPLQGGNADDLALMVRAADGTDVIAYQQKPMERSEPPPPATEPPPPDEIATVEELYLVGRHLEQYRHATRAPEPYWREGIRRDPQDSRCNTALGAWHLRRGELADAERHLRRAIATLTARNPNPAEGEPFYLLGVTLRMADRLEEAEDAFGKAAWNGGWQAAAETARATVRSREGDADGALDALERALASDPRNTWARVLQGALLRRKGQTDRAHEIIDAVLADDPLDAWALHERDLLASAVPGVPLPGGVQVHLDVAHDYALAGLDEEAIGVLARAEAAGAVHPLLPYTLAWLEGRRDNEGAARGHVVRGRAAPPDYCFPSRLEEIAVLEAAERLDPTDPRAPYYLGNLLYDRRRYDDAIRAWRRAAANDPGFSIVQRNLGIAEYNVRHRPVAARAAYVRARRSAPDDARLLYELDQLRKRLGEDPATRLSALDEESGLVASRDDLTVERVTLLNQRGRHEDALEVLRTRRFHPWEGGEGLVSGQWVIANVALARRALADGRPDDAIAFLETARTYPPNLGEGKHLLAPEHEIQLFLGRAHRAAGHAAQARHWLEHAAALQGDPAAPIGESAFWRALAHRELSHEPVAAQLFGALLEAARKRARTPVRIDYFATSLPSMLLFDDDLDARNRTECRYLIGLAQLGLGKTSLARRAFRDVLAADPNHVGAAARLRGPA
jgi:tetratricopeptide (TPR) repeat protein